jgi:type I restriction enzyme S subunit
MVKSYCCNICETKPDQKSHHDTHLKSVKHKDKSNIFSLELEKSEIAEILEKYPQYKNKFENKIELIKQIIKDMSTVVMNVKNNEPEPEVICQKYKPSNEFVWTLSENVEDKSKYLEECKKLQSIIDNTHDFIWGKHKTDGIGCMRDMMKILPFILMKKYFNSQEFKDKSKEVSLPNNKLPKYLSYSENIVNILKEENPLNQWRLFIKQFISKILPEIYTEGDGEFAFNKSNKGENTFKYMVRQFNSLDVNDNFIDSFSTSCGDIHELFRKYTGGSAAKDMGAFNTPRHALHMIYEFDKIKQLISERITDDVSIYDPTLGTGGFLTRFNSKFKINSANMYGCELDSDTIKFAFISLYMTTGNILNNIECCNSISETNNLHKKHSIGLGNPPFGTSIKYKKWSKGKGDNKETFDGELELYDKKYPNHLTKFKDIYPIDTNNGACLFTQHFIYKLEDNGLGIIILPDGEIFDGNSSNKFKEFRKWLLTNINLKMIIKMPGGTFENAGVKTNVLVFTKNGKTENIQYFDTTKECNIIKELFTITEEDLKSTNYSLDMSDYLEEEETNFEVPMVKLVDICEMMNGHGFKSSEYVENGNPIISIKNIDQNGNINLNRLKSVKQKQQYEKHILNDYDILIALTGATIGKVGKFINPDDKTYYLNQRVGKIVNIKDDKVLYNYLYLYLLSDLFQSKVKLECCDSDRNNISTNTILDFKIPLPSLEIQEKIVEELSMIETNIKSIETRIKQLKDEKESFKKYSRQSSIRKELLKGVEIKKLGEVCEFKFGKNIPKRDRVVKTNNNYPYYGSNGISGYTENYTFEGKNMLLGDQGSQWFNSLQLTDNEVKYNISNHTINISVKDEINFDYVYYVLKSLDLKKFNKDSAMIPEINFDRFKDYKIPVPSPEIQEKCIQIYQQKESFINSIDDKIESEKKYINDLKNLTKDIIYSFC